MTGMVGYDWLLIVLEHAPCDNWTTLHQIQAASRFPVAPLEKVNNIPARLVYSLGNFGCGSFHCIVLCTAWGYFSVDSSMQWNEKGFEMRALS